MEYTIERLKRCMKMTENESYDKIDKDLIPILTELNEKGYKTMYSCQGHVMNGYYITYLTFILNYTFSDPIPVFHIGSNGKNKHTKIGKTIWGGSSYHWIGSKNKNDEELELERKELIKELTKWAKKLRPREENLVTKYYLWGINGSRIKKIGDLIDEKEKDRIKKRNEFKEYKEIFAIVDSGRWRNKYRVI